MLSTPITSGIVTINTATPAAFISATIVTSSTTTATTGTTAGAYSYCYLHFPYGIPSVEVANRGWDKSRI